MNILAIDTSTKDLLLCVKTESEVFYALSEKSLQHSKILFAELENLLEKAGIEKEEIDCISVNLGPGSFTGIRIGVVFAKGMAYALGTKLVAVDAFEAIGAEALDMLPAGIICEERNGGGYFAIAKCENGKVEISKRGVHTKSEIENILKEENITKMLTNAQNDKGWHVVSGINGLLEKAETALKNGEFANASEIEPVYIKKSQAEEQLEEKLKKQNT